MKKVILTITMLLSACLTFAQAPGSQLFDDSYLHEIRFELADTNLFITTQNYQQLNMIIDGSVIDSVGIKRKGNISGYSNPNKFAIKIKTNKYIGSKNYDGVREFTLHMNYQDPTMLREKLTYDICTDMGLFSLRTAFAKVYINNDYWGLYTIVEGKDEMYKQVFNNRDMDAIESLDFGDMCYISNNPSDYDYDNNGGNPTYQLENGNAATAWLRFSNMIDKANNTANRQYLDTVLKYLNLEDFFKYQAINVFLMNMDSYIDFKGNQIYAYDTMAKLWQIIPWDFNASFGLWNTNNYIPSTYSMIPNAITNGCIAEKLNSIPQLKTYYLDAMCELQDIIGDTTVYFNKIDMLKEQIQQAVYDDHRKHVSNTDFDNGIERGFYLLFGENQPALKTFITQRLTVIQHGLVNENYHCMAVGINEILKYGSLAISPNPASDYLSIVLSEGTTASSVSIINSIGQVFLIKESDILDHINIESLNSGLYFILVQDALGKRITGKFIKK